MDFNLVEAIRAELPVAQTEGLGAHFGASSAITQKVLEGSTAVFVGGLAQQFEGRAGAERLLAMLPKEDSPLGSLLPEPTALGAHAERGQGILVSIFGERLPAVMEALSKSSGATLPTVKGLFGLVATLGLSLLGRHVLTQRLDARQLALLLAQQKAHAARAVPAGLSSLLPAGILGGAPRRVARGLEEERPAARGLSIAVVAALVFVALGGWYLLRAREWSSIALREPGRATIEERQARTPAPSRPSGTQPAPVVIPPQRPGLAEALRSPDVQLPKPFPIDNLRFAPGSARIEGGSEDRLEAVALALREHPQAQVRIEAYADPSDDASASQRLSQARAQAVKDDLVARGAPEDRISVQGHGQAPFGLAQPQPGGRADVVLLKK